MVSTGDHVEAICQAADDMTVIANDWPDDPSGVSWPVRRIRGLIARIGADPLLHTARHVADEAESLAGHLAFVQRHRNRFAASSATLAAMTELAEILHTKARELVRLLETR